MILSDKTLMTLLTALRVNEQELVKLEVSELRNKAIDNIMHARIELQTYSRAIDEVKK
jgi:hypothetical protein